MAPGDTGSIKEEKLFQVEDYQGTMGLVMGLGLGILIGYSANLFVNLDTIEKNILKKSALESKIECNKDTLSLDTKKVSHNLQYALESNKYIF